MNSNHTLPFVLLVIPGYCILRCQETFTNLDSFSVPPYTSNPIIGQDKNSNLLFQVALTSNEFQSLKSQVCSEIPANVRFTNEQQAPSNQQHPVRQSSRQHSKRPQTNVASGVFEVWLLKSCDTRVNTCYGCGDALKISGNIPKPPHDLVVASNMRREFFVDGEKRTGKPGHAYFHPNQQCICKRCPYFIPDRVNLSLHIMGQLTDVHKHHISKELGLQI